LLATIASAKAELSSQEKGFVVNMTAGLLLASRCDAKIVNGGMARLADRVGVDGERFTDAVTAAMMAQGKNLPYDREKLIPDVTRLMIAAYVEIGSEIDRNKAKTCALFMKTLRENGVVE
jgi:hypothetical protein